MTGRPYEVLTDDQQATLMRSLTSARDRLLVRVLLDEDEGGLGGAFAGRARLARLTGWTQNYVRNRLADLRRRGVVFAIRGTDGLWHYFVVPANVTPVGDVPPVGDADVPTASPRRTHDVLSVSPPWVRQEGRKNGYKARAQKTNQPNDAELETEVDPITGRQRIIPPAEWHSTKGQFRRTTAPSEPATAPRPEQPQSGEVKADQAEETTDTPSALDATVTPLFGEE